MSTSTLIDTRTNVDSQTSHESSKSVVKNLMDELSELIKVETQSYRQSTSYKEDIRTLNVIDTNTQTTKTIVLNPPTKRVAKQGTVKGIEKVAKKTDQPSSRKSNVRKAPPSKPLSMSEVELKMDHTLLTGTTRSIAESISCYYDSPKLYHFRKVKEPLVYVNDAVMLNDAWLTEMQSYQYCRPVVYGSCVPRSYAWISTTDHTSLICHSYEIQSQPPIADGQLLSIMDQVSITTDTQWSRALIIRLLLDSDHDNGKGIGYEKMNPHTHLTPLHRSEPMMVLLLGNARRFTIKPFRGRKHDIASLDMMHNDMLYMSDVVNEQCTYGIPDIIDMPDMKDSLDKATQDTFFVCLYR